VGLVARVVEDAGIPTVCVSTGRDITALVRPPRSYFVNAPMGNPFGAAGDVATQTRILRAALSLVATAKMAGLIEDDPMEWPTPFAFDPAPPTAEAREKQLKK
jgi:D-proline reductase (dithiol) PrdB